MHKSKVNTCLSVPWAWVALGAISAAHHGWPENVAFKFLLGPYFRCLPRHGRIGTFASTSTATTTTSTVTTASPAASVRISTHVDWNAFRYVTESVTHEVTRSNFSSGTNVSLERFCAHGCCLSQRIPPAALFLRPMDVARQLCTCGSVRFLRTWSARWSVTSRRTSMTILRVPLLLQRARTRINLESVLEGKRSGQSRCSYSSVNSR